MTHTSYSVVCTGTGAENRFFSRIKVFLQRSQPAGVDLASLWFCNALWICARLHCAEVSPYTTASCLVIAEPDQRRVQLGQLSAAVADTALSRLGKCNKYTPSHVLCAARGLGPLSPATYTAAGTLSLCRGARLRAPEGCRQPLLPASF